jgi:hypothetical protein
VSNPHCECDELNQCRRDLALATMKFMTAQKEIEEIQAEVERLNDQSKVFFKRAYSLRNMLFQIPLTAEQNEILSFIWNDEK